MPHVTPANVDVSAASTPRMRFQNWWLVALIVIVVAGAAGAAVAPDAAAAPSAEALEQARQAGMSFLFYTSLSLLIGAFIACVAGAFGGFQRDDA